MVLVVVLAVAAAAAAVDTIASCSHQEVDILPVAQSVVTKHLMKYKPVD